MEKESMERYLELFPKQTDSDIVHTECALCGKPTQGNKHCSECNKLWLYWKKVVEENAIR